MSALWDNLVATALLGTERRPFVLPAADGTPLTDVMVSLDPADAEGSLLKAAALAAAWQRCGFLGHGGAAQPPVEPPAAETLPRLPEAAARLLFTTLRQPDDATDALVIEAIARCATKGCRLADELVPSVLTRLVERHPQHFSAAVAAGGNLALWLAERNPAWRKAAAVPAEDRWHTGSRAERLEALREIRAADPARGIALLEAVWASESAAIRAELIDALQTGLCAEDESFLEKALADRAITVAQRAARCLARLPGSAFAQRMGRRAMAAVKYQPAKLFGKGKLIVELPALDDAAKADALSDKTPAFAPALGAQSALLCRIVGLVPPDLWLVDGMDAKTLIALARETDWSDALLHGWAHGAMLHGDSAWALALLAERLYLQNDAAAELRAALSPSDAASFAAAEIGSMAKDVFPVTALTLLAQRPVPWPKNVCRTLLNHLRSWGRTVKYGDWTARPFLRAFAFAMPPTLLPEALTGWPAAGAWPGDNIEREVTDHFLRSAELRLQLIEAFQS